MASVRYDICFRGRVQGVGFRWTARRIACDFDLGGWVRNEPGGSVRLVVEGEREMLDRFLEALGEAMGDNIEERSIDTTAASGGFAGFEIAR